MNTKTKYNVVAVVGEYRDQQSGQMKKRYQKCGTGFRDEDGRISAKIDTVPVTPGWTGWFDFYPQEESNNQESPF